MYLTHILEYLLCVIPYTLSHIWASLLREKVHKPFSHIKEWNIKEEEEKRPYDGGSEDWNPLQRFILLSSLQLNAVASLLVRLQVSIYKICWCSMPFGEEIYYFLLPHFHFLSLILLCVLFLYHLVRCRNGNQLWAGLQNYVPEWFTFLFYKLTLLPYELKALDVYLDNCTESV